MKNTKSWKNLKNPQKNLRIIKQSPKIILPNRKFQNFYKNSSNPDFSQYNLSNNKLPNFHKLQKTTNNQRKS